MSIWINSLLILERFSNVKSKEKLAFLLHGFTDVVILDWKRTIIEIFVNCGIIDIKWSYWFSNEKYKNNFQPQDKSSSVGAASASECAVLGSDCPKIDFQYLKCLATSTLRVFRAVTWLTVYILFNTRINPLRRTLFISKGSSKITSNQKLAFLLKDFINVIIWVLKFKYRHI